MISTSPHHQPDLLQVAGSRSVILHLPDFAGGAPTEADLFYLRISPEEARPSLRSVRPERFAAAEPPPSSARVCLCSPSRRVAVVVSVGARHASPSPWISSDRSSPPTLRYDWLMPITQGTAGCMDGGSGYDPLPEWRPKVVVSKGAGLSVNPSVMFHVEQIEVPQRRRSRSLLPPDFAGGAPTYASLRQA